MLRAYAHALSLSEEPNSSSSGHVGMDTHKLTIYENCASCVWQPPALGVNGEFRAVAGTSAITPTTCLCTSGLGMRRSSTSLLCHTGSQPASWAKPCKSSLTKCWKKVGESRLKGQQLEGSSRGMPSFKMKRFRLGWRSQLCWARL